MMYSFKAQTYSLTEGRVSCAFTQKDNLQMSPDQFSQLSQLWLIFSYHREKA